ncbi:MAG: SCO family protein [Planctomycetales bacterium]|nr:SCO family protein [Planctomycetales bacterium]
MSGRWSIAMAACWGVWLSTTAVAQVNLGQVPAEIAAVEQVDRRIDSMLPLSASFVDDEGHRVALRDYVGDLPIVVSLNYSDCPMLCQAQLRDFVAKFSAAGMEPNTDFQLVSISIDPHESVERARDTKQKYLELSGKPASRDGWHFLTGEKAEIDRVANGIGVSYTYVPSRKEYAHPAVFVICTPEGRISQYLNATQYDEETLRLTVVEASEGKLGTAGDWLALACFVYDPNSNSYVFAARRVMQWGAGATIVMLLVGLIPFWIGLSRRRQLDSPRNAHEQSDVGQVPIGTDDSGTQGGTDELETGA